MKNSSYYKLNDILVKERELFRKVNENKASWCVFGGAAVSIYGGSRDIKDIDILMNVKEFDIKEFLNISISSSNLIKSLNEDIEIWANPLVFKKDINYNFYIDEEMIKRINHMEIEGFLLPIISREDLIVIKLIMNRNKEEGKYDFFDIQELIIMNENNRKLDLEYMCYRAQKVGAWNILKDRIEIMRS